MATTTATLSLSSDMLSSPISISASSTLMKAGVTEGLELIEMGRGTIAETDGSKTAEFGLPTALGADKAAKLFLVNKATDPTYYIDIDLHDTNIGRLYAGDWMFIPWGMNDTASELVIEAEPSGATCPYEFVLLQEPQTLEAHS
jgi:hypothetical protein|tara:strand:- start:384 stop:815 length:432 start_codon:yes stop_codon:yes gene_type:complete